MTKTPAKKAATKKTAGKKTTGKNTAAKPTTKTEPVGLQPGNKAPAFRLPADQGGTVALGALKGQTVVLYFYPKDDTSGCTKEAIDFSTKAKAFTAAGAIVIGVSKDSVSSHDAFKAKHRLALTLASDEDTKTAAAYGVWVEKSMYGRRYMGMERATFVIDGKGVVRHVWRKVKVPGHADEVLAAVKAL
jgi:peroxiredoxin Q/BCP